MKTFAKSVRMPMTIKMPLVCFNVFFRDDCAKLPKPEGCDAKFGKLEYGGF
jgi:hypothetical protein